MAAPDITTGHHHRVVQLTSLAIKIKKYPYVPDPRVLNDVVVNRQELMCNKAAVIISREGFAATGAASPCCKPVPA